MPSVAARLTLLALVLAPFAVRAAQPVLLIHGGAGTLRADEMSAEQRAAYEAALETALDAGWRVLADGGSAEDAVVAAILPMEDSPLFNAGRGAVYTATGAHELDAAIMVGRTRDAGAVGGVSGVRHPILLARRVMEASPHVFLAGPGAREFAEVEGLEIMPDHWFHTERRRRQLDEFLARDRDVRPPADGRMDTDGAVALDRSGRLAAGTSTGGTTGKRYGRLGDVPVIGAGTWADARCAVSATGDGEYFIRAGAARSVCHRMAAGEAPGKAAGAVLSDIRDLGGLGGMIVLDGEGGFTLSFSTEGMYRGHVHAGGRRVAIFGE